MQYVCLVYSTLNLDLRSRACIDSQQPLSGLSPPTRDARTVTQISNDFGWVCGLREGRKCEGRPTVWDIHQVCEEANHRSLPECLHLPVPAADNHGALEPNAIAYASQGHAATLTPCQYHPAPSQPMPAQMHFTTNARMFLLSHLYVDTWPMPPPPSPTIMIPR